MNLLFETIQLKTERDRASFLNEAFFKHAFIEIKNKMKLKQMRENYPVYRYLYTEINAQKDRENRIERETGTQDAILQSYK